MKLKYSNPFHKIAPQAISLVLSRLNS